MVCFEIAVYGIKTHISFASSPQPLLSQDLMGSPLQTTSSFGSVTGTAMEILHWGCWLEQQLEWLWDHYFGSSRLPCPYLCSSKPLYCVQ